MVFTFKFNQQLLYQFLKTYFYRDNLSYIYHVVSILLDSIHIQFDTEMLFARSTDVSIHIQIGWTTVASVLNDIFISW